MRKLLSDEQENFVKENYMIMTYKEMSNLELFCGINEKQLRNRARGMGLKKTRAFDKRYFKNIDTREKAYWLGFIYADGWIVESSEFGIELHEKDKYILELLNSDLGDVHQITYRERTKEFNGYEFTSYTNTLRIYSRDMANDLKNNNIVPRKTYSNIFPKVEDKFFFHFLRGFMDGDGCISDNLLFFTNANKEFLEHLQIHLLENYSIKGAIYKEKELKYRLLFNKHETEKILPKIYHDSGSHYLTRKKSLYLGSPSGKPEGN